MSVDYAVLVVDKVRRFDRNGDEFPPVTYARDAATGITLLQKRKWDQVWLDPEMDEIGLLVRAMIHLQPKITVVYLQSLDPVSCQPFLDSLQPHYRTYQVYHPNLRVLEDV